MSKSDERPHTNIATVLSHTLFILILLVLPELMQAISHPGAPWRFYPGFYVKTFFFLCVFYVNYFYLIDRNLSTGRQHIMRFMALNLALVAVALTLNYIIGDHFFPIHHGRKWEHMNEWQRIARHASFILRDMVMMILAIGLATAMRLSTRWDDIQAQKRELIAARKDAELEQLKSQLNPHFLFNTLNSIYALIEINSENAQKAVHTLSGMLRYMLYEDAPEVPLSRETDFIENYIALMKLRMRTSSHPLHVNIDTEGFDNVAIPPLLFIPLVENAFKYGTDGPEGESVNIEIKACDNNGRTTIICHTANGFNPGKKDNDRKRSGIGLANLRRRLVLIYGRDASLRTSVDGNRYMAELTINLGDKPESVKE